MVDCFSFLFFSFLGLPFPDKPIAWRFSTNNNTNDKSGTNTTPWYYTVFRSFVRATFVRFSPIVLGQSDEGMACQREQTSKASRKSYTIRPLSLLMCNNPPKVVPWKNEHYLMPVVMACQTKGRGLGQAHFEMVLPFPPLGMMAILTIPK